MEMIEGNLLAGYALENAFLVAGKEMKELHGEGGLMQTELEIINRKVCMNQPLEVVFEEFAKKSGIEEIENFQRCSLLQSVAAVIWWGSYRIP